MFNYCSTALEVWTKPLLRFTICMVVLWLKPIELSAQSTDTSTSVEKVVHPFSRIKLNYTSSDYCAGERLGLELNAVDTNGEVFSTQNEQLYWEDFILAWDTLELNPEVFFVPYTKEQLDSLVLYIWLRDDPRLWDSLVLTPNYCKSIKIDLSGTEGDPGTKGREGHSRGRSGENGWPGKDGGSGGDALNANVVFSIDKTDSLKNAKLVVLLYDAIHRLSYNPDSMSVEINLDGGQGGRGGQGGQGGNATKNGLPGNGGMGGDGGDGGNGGNIEVFTDSVGLKNLHYLKISNRAGLGGLAGYGGPGGLPPNEDYHDIKATTILKWLFGKSRGFEGTRGDYGFPGSAGEYSVQLLPTSELGRVLGGYGLGK